MFQGVFTALITPFKDDKVDERALRDLIEWQIQEGIYGLVPCGTTGEAPTLSDDEYERVVRLTVDQVAARAPVIAGAGSNSTRRAIALTKIAYKCGANATLHVTPYYNKPTQEGLYQHFKAVAEAVDLPVILYNVPGRTGVNLLHETVIRLMEGKVQSSKHALSTAERFKVQRTGGVVGIKEASGDLAKIKKLTAIDGLAVLSGDDALNLAIYEIGGVGAISVTSNMMPAKVAAVWNEFNGGRREKAKLLHEELQPLNRALFIETNPIPVKTALAIMGRCKEEFRLPLTKMEKENRERLEEVLKGYGVITNNQ